MLRTTTTQDLEADSQLVCRFIQSGAQRRGLFIDCGSNLGQGFDQFSQHYSSAHFDYLLIEPNPFCVQALHKMYESFEGNLRILPEAAGTSFGEVKFYGLKESGNLFSEGGSILADHNSECYTPSEADVLTVNQFRFSNLIFVERQKYDVLIVKMDIEGAEYSVLEDLLESNLHKAICILYIEFHSSYMKAPENALFKEKERSLIRRLVEDKVVVRRWH
jgi:FkbM family methyltransferase